MEEYPKKQPVSRKQVFLRFMRYVSVFSVTIVFTIMAIMCSGLDGFDLDLTLFCFILIFTYLFFITIPIIGFWIYSFIKSIKRSTKTDCILLYFHIADLILLGLIIYLDVSRGELDCNAEIMAKHYEKYHKEMHDVVDNTRMIMPDNLKKYNRAILDNVDTIQEVLPMRPCLEIEFGNSDYLRNTEILNEEQKDKLQRSLSDIGCIGIEIGNCRDWEYSTIRFRRVGMGMYSFRLYNQPLTSQQQDSINANECLIVYNDSTVFEFSGGVFGTQVFVGKDEFLKSRKK